MSEEKAEKLLNHLCFDESAEDKHSKESVEEEFVEIIESDEKDVSLDEKKTEEIDDEFAISTTTTTTSTTTTTTIKTTTTSKPTVTATSTTTTTTIIETIMKEVSGEEKSSEEKRGNNVLIGYKPMTKHLGGLDYGTRYIIARIENEDLF